MKHPSPEHFLFHAQILVATILFSLLNELGMTVKGGTSQACAACKYQRRRCSKDCALAPYFPADQPKMFQNAHRLFGVSNIMKILRQLRQPHKDEAMRSIIYESNMRARFPVLGCWGIIYQLHLQVQQVADELGHVRSQLAMCREQQFMLPDTFPSGNNEFDGNAKTEDMMSFYQIRHQEIEVSGHEYDEIATDIVEEVVCDSR